MERACSVDCVDEMRLVQRALIRKNWEAWRVGWDSGGQTPYNHPHQRSKSVLALSTVHKLDKA